MPPGPGLPALESAFRASRPIFPPSSTHDTFCADANLPRLMKWLSRLLCCLVYFGAGLRIAAAAGAATNSATVALSSPSDWQVLQRQTARTTPVRVIGRGPAGRDLEWRLLAQDPSLPPVKGWDRLAAPSPTGEFQADVPMPEGGWYRLEVRVVGTTDPGMGSNLGHLGVGEVFLIAGQSNAGNHGGERQSPRSGLVSRFDGVTWSPAADPQRGASGDGGSFLPAFGDALAARLKVPIAVVPVAEGATSVREWLPQGTPVKRLPTTGQNMRPVASGGWEATGALYGRLLSRFAALGPRGFRAVLWHQGESDAGQARAGYPADRQISGTDYINYMNLLIDASRRDAGWEVPWYTAQATYHSEQDPEDSEFRAAQKSLWQSGRALEGPDTDALRTGFRDGVHFNGAGLQRHGQLWAERVAAGL